MVMDVNLQIKINGKAAQGITAMIIDGPASWVEIAATTNEQGQISLPVNKKGTYRVKLFTEIGEHIVDAETDGMNEFNL